MKKEQKIKHTHTQKRQIYVANAFKNKDDPLAFGSSV